MEEGKKKLVMFVIIVACLGIAGAITVMTRSGSSGSGIEDLDPTEMIWVKCGNEVCDAEYQVGKQAYYIYLRDNRDPMAMTAPPMVCNECGEESVHQAVKCENCGIVFFKGAVPHDFADRCPECKHSATEENRKARKRKQKS